MKCLLQKGQPTGTRLSRNTGSQCHQHTNLQPLPSISWMQLNAQTHQHTTPPMRPPHSRAKTVFNQSHHLSLPGTGHCPVPVGPQQVHHLRLEPPLLLPACCCCCAAAGSCFCLLPFPFSAIACSGPCAWNARAAAQYARLAAVAAAPTAALQASLSAGVCQMVLPLSLSGRWGCGSASSATSSSGSSSTPCAGDQKSSVGIEGTVRRCAL